MAGPTGHSRGMSTTQERLDYYLLCEENILKGAQRVDSPDRRRVYLADLAQIREQINVLKRQLRREKKGIGHKLADFPGSDRRPNYEVW